MANVDFLFNQSLLQICVSLQGSHPSYLAILTISIFQHCYIYMTLPQKPWQGTKHWKDKNQQLSISSLKWHIPLTLMFYQPVTVTWLRVTSRERERKRNLLTHLEVDDNQLLANNRNAYHKILISGTFLIGGSYISVR